MTKLLVMFNNLDPRTAESVKRFAPEAGLEPEWIDTSASQQVYADELEKRWTGDEDIILIEHDKEIFGVTLPEMLACDAPWCTCPYWLFPEPHTTLCLGGFGCTKFSAEIQRRVPVSAFRGPFWLGIDRRFNDYLLTLGIGACLHSMVTHHHVYEPRPEFVRSHVADLRERGLIAPAMAPAAPEPGLLPGSYRLS